MTEGHIFASSGAILLALVGAALAGSAVTAAAFLTFGPRARHSLDAYIEAADYYGRVGNHGKEQYWLSKARQLAPANASLALREAKALLALGLVDEAFHALDRAHELSTDGHAAFEAAKILDRLGYDDKAIEQWLAAALQASPELAAQIAPDTFRSLRFKVGE